MNNRIRLPFYVKRPQFPIEANRFRLADGSSKTLSVVVRKTYELETDYLTERMHQRLVIALTHDTISIEGQRYIGGVVLEGDYQVEYPDFLDYPLGKAKTLLQVTPFDVTNDNCQTCEQASQLSLEDDSFESALTEGSSNEISAFDNDSICCSPITAGITTFNTTYVESATIDQATGVITIVIKNPAPSGTNVLLATYRVTCPDGSYDEASIYGTVSGSIESCEPLSDVEATATGIDTATVEWTASPSTPEAYGYQLFECDDLGTVVQSGTTPTNSVDLTGLTANTCYRLVVWAICDVASNVVSETTFGEFTTGEDLPSCGRFLLTNNLYPDEPTGTASYMDCGGTITNIIVKTTRTICMLVDSSNNPVYFVSESGSDIIYQYQEPC